MPNTHINGRGDVGSIKRKQATFFSSTAAPAPSFHPFPRFALEIATRIITLACTLPSLRCSKDAEAAEPAAERSIPAQDVATALSLTTVSRSIGQLATSFLWETARITKPSALLELYAAVEKRPELAERIKHLDMGGEGIMPTDDWPLELNWEGNLRRSALFLKNGLREDEKREVIQWCRTQQHWPLQADLVDRGRRKHLAVVEAVESALLGLDVDPHRRELGLSGIKLGLELWATRTFELQACLDLYLMEIHRIDSIGEQNSHPWRKAGRLRHTSPAGPQYPPLVVTGYPSGSSGDPRYVEVMGGAFVITRAQVWQHLTRRGSVLDHFDHPILFARTGSPGPHINDYGRALLRGYLTGPYPRVFNVQGVENLAVAQVAADEANTVMFQGPAPQWTICAINMAASGLIDRLASLVNLSLTGTLDFCLLCHIGTFKTLRSLSVGPLLRIWQDSALLKLAAPYQLRDLQNLRVAGAFINTKEAGQIAGQNGCFPSLKRFQYEAVQSCKPHEKSSTLFARPFIELIRLLQGTPAGEDTRAPPRFIEIHLHPEPHAEIYALLPEKTRKAWRSGALLDVDDSGNVPPHRIRLTESEAAKIESSEREDAGLRTLRAGSKRWFEDCAALVKDPSLDQGEGWMPGCEGGVWTDSKAKVETEE